MTIAAAIGAEIRRFLDARREDQTAFLAELVRTPADNPPGDCAPHAAHTAALLAGLGLRVEKHPVPAEACRARGMVSDTNLVVRERFGAGPIIALNAHADAVPPGEGWSADPYGAEIRDGVMLGRGVAVSKGDVATYVFALLALRASKAALRGTVELHLTYDEEVSGFLGPGWLLRHGVSRPDYAICAGFTYFVGAAHNGCLQLEVTLAGRSAHAAMPEDGRDALAAATSVLGALYAHREGYGGTTSSIPGIDAPTLVVGRIEGGTSTNVVPGRVALWLDRRVIPEENPAAVERALVELIRDAAAPHPGIDCRIERLLLAEPLVRVEGTDRLIAVVAGQARAVLGEEIPACGVPLFTDARHYSSAGIPTVMYGAGPRRVGDCNVHEADERLALEDLRKATEVVARSLVDLLS